MPEAFSSMMGSSESISLSWEKPAGILQSYELLYRNGSSGSSSEIKAPVDAGQLTYNLTGLSSDSNYTFKLRTISFDQSSDNGTTSSWTRE